MKYIDKTGDPPQKLTTWTAYHDTALQQLYVTAKAKDIWKYLDNHTTIDGTTTSKYSKAELKTTLIEEQGYICCYCGKRVENDYRAVIEHLNPKSIYKDRTYDYINLLVSCDGGKHYKVHVVKAGETLASIAQDYGVSEEYLIEIYIETDMKYHIKALTKLYDIEKLKVGDRIFIIPYQDAEFHHCDAKKDDNEITLHPTQRDIESYFSYLPDGEIDESVSNELKATIETLGLNKSPLLLKERKDIIDTAKSLKIDIWQRVNKDVKLYKQAIRQLCNKYYTPNDQGQVPPYAFVTVAVLTA